MKKMIFGCALMISGMIGAVGWLIASVSLVQDGAWSSLFNVFSDIEGWIVILFFMAAVIGGIMAARSLKEDK